MHCLHGLYVLQTADNLVDIYETVNRLLSEGYAVIYAVDEPKASKDASKTQRLAQIYSNMKQSQLIKDIEACIESRALTIVDAEGMYLSRQYYNTASLKRLASLIRTIKHQGNFKDIAIICGSISRFSDTTSLNKLVAYEQRVSESVKKLRSVCVICCYPEKSLDEIQFDQLMSIVNTHQCIVGCIDGKIEPKSMNSAVIF